MPMITSDHRVEVLAKLPLFAGLSHRDLRKVAKRADEVHVRAGSHLCEEGQHGEGAYVLVDVGANVVVAGKHLATLAPGEICGELSLLDGGPRSATITVDGDGTVLLMSRDAFLEALQEVPALVGVVLTSLGERLRTANAVGAGTFLGNG